MKKSLVLASSAIVLAGLAQVASAGTTMTDALCSYKIVVVNDCGKSFDMFIVASNSGFGVDSKPGLVFVNEKSSPKLLKGSLMTEIDAAHPKCPPFVVSDNNTSVITPDPLYLPSNTAANFSVTFARGLLGICVPSITRPRG